MTPEELIDTNHIILDYENLNLLLRLYGSIQYSNELTEFFIGYLSNYITDKHKGHLVTEILIKIGHEDKPLAVLSPFKISELLPVLDVLDELLYFEYKLFSKEKLKQIRAQLEGVLNFKNNVKKKWTDYKKMYEMGERILQRMDLIFYEDLTEALKEGTNFQIESDKEKIKEKIRLFGFDTVLSDAIDKIEEMYWDTSADKFDYSMAISKLRAFWEKTVELICNKINDKTKEEYPKTEDTKMGNLRIYMKKHLQLDKEHFLTNKLVEILNGEGSHKLISEKEYFRLTKNITIEVAMLHFVKLEKFME